ncbi:uncharacterized protein LOC111700732 [Eurytemora carolleeae]|uniref:uncharacterized protein LOC111700732 n=1 Tax=Eurytemora carolleeae TaxID=1294199 RepID=UPI000C75DCEE|nr:uncharacterized protein LOC111700732 [Eurytemora carolleeae]|eukprot:XP_023327524.1 uncharacterized protein LOC111700732 [Eurytemora affinis]
METPSHTPTIERSVSPESEGESEYEEVEHEQHQGSVSFNVVTRNIKKVEWPPKHDEIQTGGRLPPHRRFKTDWNFPQADKPITTYPFSRGYNPSKLEKGTIWSPEPTSTDPAQQDRPKVVLREANDVLSHGISQGHSHYRMPPGTSRTRKCQENYETVLANEKKV